ncbi:uncharacterized protein LY79DRAFT_583468 [Colletotrichum navitas]|uniref:Uncharacterized protein n=1 Tax=Colletotrichum navitas TaxID=681940 RepID=A0AAD8PP55_9PEZI|nr:uncharacterized protein LY79DRAFT_583468 [Colletotrichum navitas]KAK1573712.1 hypothetical protein LY79DRAFT_583468 [Colletotrichum navitas]
MRLVAMQPKSHRVALLGIGVVPGFVLGSKFERVKVFVGGLRFALVGFSGGLGKLPEFQTVTDKIHICLPAPRFNNKTTLIDTAEGLQNIEINYTGLKGETIASGVNFIAQRISRHPPPIHSYLPGHCVLSISAVITKAEGHSKVFVNISFNEESLRLVTSGAHDGTITWNFEWSKIPTEEGQNPQLINVNATIWNGIVGPLAKTSIIVQGYIVHFVILQRQE